MDIQTSQAQQPRLAGGVPAAEPQGLDIVRVLWRWKFLPILGALIGMALGWLHYSTLPPLYIATEQIRVVSPIQANSRNQPYNSDDIMQMTRLDESMVISSPLVIKLAAEKLVVDPVAKPRPAIGGKSAEAVAGYIASNRRLTVAPAAKDSNTSLVNISFVCEDKHLSPLVVNAIIQGYSDYQSEEYKTVGNEIYKLMTEAQKRVGEEMATLLSNIKKAKDSIEDPVIWADGVAINPFKAEVQSINNRLSALAMEKNTLISKYNRAQKALESGIDPSAVLLLLTDAEHIDLTNGQTMNNRIIDDMVAQQQLESERMERQELFPLEVQERSFLGTVGESHPRLAILRQKIELVKKKIDSVRAAERAMQAEADQRKSELKEQAANEPVPIKIVTPEKRLSHRLEAMQQSKVALEEEVAGLQEMKKELDEKSRELDAKLQAVEDYNIELKQVQNLYEITLEKLKQLELGPTASQRTLKELTIQASEGGFYGPKLLPYLVAGGAIGFMLLAGLAVLLDLADKSFRSPDDIAAEIGAPVLGHIPAMELDKIVKKPNQSVDGSLCTIHHSRGRVSEAYRSVRTGLFFSNRMGDLKVIQVTSPVPGDGKSTLSSNLAVTMAQSGRSVLLIDADFRRPRIAKLFNIDSDNGMATAVAGACELDDAIHPSTIPGLSIMPGGRRPSNPAELLSSQRFADLLGALREKFDVIIVDTPPLLAVSDPSAIAAVVDGVVLTIRLRRNVKPLVTRAAKILESVDSKLLGIVVNGVSSDAGYGYNYGYRDYRYQYRYGYQGYSNKGYYGNKYLDEAHDVDTDHVLVQSKPEKDEPLES